VAEPGFVFSVPARDGRLLWFRPVVPADRSLLVEGYRHLSDDSRLKRFNALYEELTSEQLRFLAELDYHDRYAWGVMIGPADDREGAAMGRYARYRNPTADGFIAADLGITVLDKFQGIGIGTELVKALIITGHANGIDRFVTQVLARNDAMLGVFRLFGAEIGPVELGTVEVTVELAPAAETLADHPLSKLIAGYWSA
jgi:RimJ/RimL family protein N-acetyltransferase